MSGRTPRIVGLKAGQLAQIKKLTGYSGTIDKIFFEEAVWWWRPLLRILGPSRRRIAIPSKAQRHFFSESFFEALVQAEATGDLGDQWSYLLMCELAVRLDGGLKSGGLVWPGFLADKKITVYGDDFMSAHIAELPRMVIDLRRSTSDLLGEVTKVINALREKRREALPFPTPPMTLKSSYLSPHTFARIELIDRRISMRDTHEAASVSEGEWANVTKLVRERFVARRGP